MVRKLSWSLGCRLVAMFVPSSPACGSVLCICDLWLTSCPTGYSLIAPFINLNCCVPKLHYHNYLFSLPSCGYDLLPSNYLSPSCCLPSFPTHSHFHQTGSLFILADPPPSCVIRFVYCQAVGVLPQWDQYKVLSSKEEILCPLSRFPWGHKIWPTYLPCSVWHYGLLPANWLLHRPADLDLLLF